MTPEFFGNLSQFFNYLQASIYNRIDDELTTIDVFFFDRCSIEINCQAEPRRSTSPVVYEICGVFLTSRKCAPYIEVEILMAWHFPGFARRVYRCTRKRTFGASG